MAHSKQELNSEKRKQEKAERKRANIAAVQETKRKKTVWELINDERAGLTKKESEEEDDSSKRKFKIRVRKVKAENRLSHHKGHGDIDASVCIKTLNGNIVRVKRTEADKMVKAGSATYAKKKEWKETLVHSN